MEGERSGLPRTLRSEWRERLSDASRILALALVYDCAGKLGLQLAFFNRSVSPVWPPTGIALAAILILGRRVWPGICLGAFLVNATTGGSTLSALGIAAGNTLEAVVGAALAERFARGRLAFEDARGVFRYTVFAASPCTMIGATCGVISLASGGFASWRDDLPIWTTWWLGDLIGAVLIAPLIVIWIATPLPRWGRRRVVEAALMLAVVASAGLLIFGGLLPARFEGLARPFMALPPLLWGAYRFGPRGAVSSVILLGSLGLWGTLHGHGPFVLKDPNDSLLLLQGFLGTSALTTLVLGAAAADGRRAGSALRRSQKELQRRALEIEKLYQTAPIGLCLLDPQLRFVRINERLAEINGLSATASLGLSLRDALPQLAGGLEPALRQVLASRQPLGPHEINGTTQADPGVEHSWLGSYFPISDSAGEISGISVVLQDITERRRAEDALLSWHTELEARVQRRTADLVRAQEELQTQIDERRKLEAQITGIVEREHLRIGSELHDGLGQQLAGIGLLLAALGERLRAASPDRAEDARRLQILVEQSVKQTRSLARRFYPVELEGQGLLAILQNFARTTDKLFGVRCIVRSEDAGLERINGPTAIQIYRIVQEAVHNAVKHGRAKRAVVNMTVVDDGLCFTITDDGVGLPAELDHARGMGLRIMRYRARMLGGTLDVHNGDRLGVVVRCTLPAAILGKSPDSERDTELREAT